MNQDPKYLGDELKPVDTLIAILCFAVLIFFAAPDLVRWIWSAP